MRFWKEKKQAERIADVKPSRCRSCGRPVKFLPAMFGWRTRVAAFPIDPQPDARGKYYQTDSGLIRSAGGELKKVLKERYGIAFYTAHSETCPVKGERQ